MGGRGLTRTDRRYGCDRPGRGPIFYLLRLGAACDSALPAAFFDAFPVRPSRRTWLAALAAAGEVLRCFAMSVTSLSD